MGKKNSEDKTLPAHPKKPTTPPASLNPSRPRVSPRYSLPRPPRVTIRAARGLCRDTKARECESGCARRRRAPSAMSLSRLCSGAPSPGPWSRDGRADPTQGWAALALTHWRQAGRSRRSSLKVGRTGRGVQSAEVAARGSRARALGRGCSWAGFFLSSSGGSSAPPAAASAAAAAAALGRLLLLLLLHRGPAAPGCSGFPALGEWKLRKRKKKKKKHRPAQRKAAASEPALPSSSPLRGSAAPPAGEARPPGGGGAEGRGPSSVWPDSGVRPLAAGLGRPPHCPLCPGPSSAAVAPYPPLLGSRPGKCRETPRDPRRFRGSLRVGALELRGTRKKVDRKADPREGGLGEGKKSRTLA